MDINKSSGLILHPTSLPSSYGIGDLGKESYEFIDLLNQSGLKYGKFFLWESQIILNFHLTLVSHLFWVTHILFL